MTWVLDLDGVVWHGAHAIEGAANAVAKLQANGTRVGYVTNNSTMGADALIDKFASFGIETTANDIVSAHDLLVEKVGTGKRVMACCAPGLADALSANGNTVYRVQDFKDAEHNDIKTPPDVDVVVGGQNYTLDYLGLSVGLRAILQCGVFYSANRDPLYPASSGMLIGTGSIIAALETGSNTKATIFGKPEQTMVDAFLERFPDATMLVGDQLSMDGVFAQRANIPFGHVLSGVDAQRASNDAGVPIAYQAEDLAALVEAVR